jgi:hypothetical protein
MWRDRIMVRVYEDSVGGMYLAAGGLTADVSHSYEDAGLKEISDAVSYGISDWLVLVENPVDMTELKLVADSDGHTVRLYIDQMGVAAKRYYGIP